MKRPAFGALLLIMSASAAWASAPAVAPSTVELLVPQVESIVEKAPALKSDAGCNPAGYKVYDSVAEKIGLVRNSTSVLKSLLGQTDDQTSSLESDSSHCGDTCTEVNEVSTITATVPNSWGKVGTCTSQEPQVLESDFATQDQLQSYMNDTLQGKNAEGKSLAAACASPCAYHVATAITPKANNAQHLTLSVLCGPPRSGSILFAQYYFSAGLVQQWSCHKK